MTSHPRTVSEHAHLLGHERFPVYLVRGRAAALVEVGISATAPLVLRQLADLGVDRLDHIVVTHPHADHLTGIDRLRAAWPEALVWAANDCLAWANRPQNWPGVNAEDAFMSRAVQSDGPDGAGPGRFLGLGSRQLIVPSGRGDELDLGGGVGLELHAATGHARGGLFVRVVPDEVILASDSAGFYFPPDMVLPLYFMDYAGYVQTLDRIIAFDPRHLGLGHQGGLTGAEVRPFLDRARASAVNTRDELASRARAGEPIEDIEADLFTRAYVREMTIYSAENIRRCTKLLVRRSLDAADH